MTPITVLNLGPGATVAFEPGGKHVMLFGVSKSLKPGATAKVTLNFSGGKEAVGELTIETAGGAEHHQ
jgi:copper(I)-binding protein